MLADPDPPAGGEGSPGQQIFNLTLLAQRRIHRLLTDGT
jgi:hypothetical protein